MKSVITVFKEEFQDKADLVATLKEMCDEMACVAGTYVISTRPGNLFDVLHLLRENKIAYGTTFDS